MFEASPRSQNVIESETAWTNRRIDDRAAILIASPLLGFFVASATGMMRDAPAEGTLRWASYFCLAVIAGVIWTGNRFLFYLVRDAAGGSEPRQSPRRRIAIVIAYTVMFSAPVAFAANVGWYLVFAAGPINWPAVQAATALATVTALFLCHAYEAVLTVQEQAEQRLAAEKAERRRLEAEVRSLEGQLDPHFIYNALCSLGFLIETNRARAGAYVAQLSGVYAYVAQTYRARLVTLDEELAFARAYGELLRLRHGAAIRISFPDEATTTALRIVPISIQLAIENAAKHNDMSAEKPLRIDVQVTGEYVEISNNKQTIADAQDSLGVGLPNLSNRCRLCIGRDTLISDDPQRFTLRIPLRRDDVDAQHRRVNPAPAQSGAGGSRVA